MGFIDREQVLRIAAPLKGNAYAKYLLAMIADSTSDSQ